jgi:hypothetical protein
MCTSSAHLARWNSVVLGLYCTLTEYTVFFIAIENYLGAQSTQK